MSEADSRLSVVVMDKTRSIRQDDQQWIAGLLQGAAHHLGCSGEVRVAIVADAEMSSAHALYAGVVGTTDVLTFSLAPVGTPVDADIMVCLDEAVRLGDRLRHEPRRELLLYALHGLLHALGYDDHDDASYKTMHDTEDRLLEDLGIGRTFGADR